MDYKKSDIVGNKWHRFSTINISNPRVGIPSVICNEQEVFSLGTTEVIRDVGTMYFEFNTSKEFDILNPSTGEVIGTGTGAQVYALVYSYVMAEAKLRDEKLVNMSINQGSSAELPLPPPYTPTQAPATPPPETQPEAQPEAPATPPPPPPAPAEAQPEAPTEPDPIPAP